MSEEWELANNIELLTHSAIEKGNLDTCMIYGISGNCGKKCPKFKDKTCEVYLDTLENEYNSDENEIEKLHSIIKEIEKTLEDNYGGLSISDYERLIDLCKRK